MGGLRARVPLRARQPDRDHRREPPRPARRDDGGLEPRSLRRTSRGVRLERSRGRRTRRRGDRRRVARAVAITGAPTVVVARTKKGKGVAAVEDENGFHGKPLDDPDAAIAELGGLRDIHVEVTRPEAATARDDRSAKLELPRYEIGAEVATRKAYGDALAALGCGAARRRRARRRGVQLDFRRDVREGASRAVLRDVHRGAADDRRGSRAASRRLAPVRVDLRGFPLPRLRLHAHGRREPRDPRAVRIARRRLDRRGRAVSDGARGHRLPPRGPRLHGSPPLRCEPDRQARRRHGRSRGNLVPPHTAPGDAGPLQRRGRVRDRRKPCPPLER